MEREELLQLYKNEKDSNVKDRLMLIIKVVFDNDTITAATHSLGSPPNSGAAASNRSIRIVYDEFAAAQVAGSCIRFSAGNYFSSAGGNQIFR